MSYRVLARKWRPQSFDDLVGQEHVAKTIASAIKQDRVAHAFLFTGVRGVGKTTTARLLAKCLDCEKGPTSSPCGTCAPCTEIANGNDVDVLEIDGASNNSVDDVRRLQETLPYRPQRDRFKIVTIDEVHMLSSGAFNALLKTLEEPPSHVKFIFATTEAHKVPVTIVSRCQRYDFRLISRATIAARVRHILEAEAIAAEEAAIGLLAREANGSMRDALTMLDQVIAGSDGKLTATQAASVLGIADRETTWRALRAVVEGDPATCLAAVDGVAAQGRDVMHFARELASLARDVVAWKVGGERALVGELVDEERVEADRVAGACSATDLARTFAGLVRGVDEMGKSLMPRLVLEAWLVRLADRPALEPIGELVGRLEQLERRLGGGGPGTRPTGGGAGSPPGRRPPGAPSAPPSRGNAPGFTPPRSSSPLPKGERETGRELAPGPMDARPLSAQRQGEGPGEGRGEGRAPAELARVTPIRAASSAPVATASGPVAQRDAGPARFATPPPPPSTGAAAVAAPRAPALPEDVDTAGGDPLARWAPIVERVGESHPALGTALSYAVPREVSASRIVIAFPPNSFFGRQTSTPESRASLARAAAEILGEKPTIDIRLDGTETGTSVARVQAERVRNERAEKEREAREHPSIGVVLSVFEGEIKSVDVDLD